MRVCAQFTDVYLGFSLFLFFFVFLVLLFLREKTNVKLSGDGGLKDLGGRKI